MRAPLLLTGWVLILILAHVVCSCSPIYYASNAHNVPLLKEKHEVRINAGLTSTEILAGPDVQAAYAVGKNIGIITNGTYLRAGDNSRGYGYLLEAGGGYFKLLDKGAVAEIYVGAGYGKVINIRNSDPFKLNFIKPFIQPAFGYSTTYFDVAFSPKIAWVHFNQSFVLDYEFITDANGNYIVKNGNYETRVLKEKQTFFAFEPGITFRSGWKYIKLQLQAVTSLQEIPNAENLSINLGLSVNLAKRFRKIPK